MPITPDTMHRFVALAAERIHGDLVVLGGAVLPLVGVFHRVTHDVDVAAPDEATLDLFRIADELGLPPEAVNQAAAFFLHRIPDWRDHLILVREGRAGRVHRPDAALYILLKLSRLSESDLADCLAYLDATRARGEPVRAEVIEGAIHRETRRRPGKDRLRRLKVLLAALERSG